MALETQEVCKICFNSTSHKTNATLTPIHKALVDRDGNRSCPTCRQQPWLTETVTKDEHSRRWVVVRPPPRIEPLIDYQLCVNNPKNRLMCRNGSRCTYAHSMVELKEWNRKRYQQPRQAPNLHGPYQMCKDVQRTGICKQRCKFAHSKEELEHWEKCSENKHRKTSRRPYRPQAPRRSSQSSDTIIRPRPNIVINHGYKMCKLVLLRRPCYYGDNCTFAHTKEEQQQWNEELDYDCERQALFTITSYHESQSRVHNHESDHELPRPPTVPIPSPRENDDQLLQRQPKLKDLMNKIAAKTTDKWFQVGIQLDIDPTSLTTYERDHQDSMRRYTSVFEEWRRKHHPPYTWATIIGVLKMDAVNEVDTADSVQKWLTNRQ